VSSGNPSNLHACGGYTIFMKPPRPSNLSL